ncbi:unnamed protein product [Eruca vesicaria subsp. sativa]|uniref:Pentatricopeptide repeat-containing protein n=1 Tax=Eruca vesicaria subsp. sativa TaxID=29727 RepID=A0ABC8K6J0_ERUVS|nr:unnamed protein product [Eruca vesicaria subsp. sativa]
MKIENCLVSEDVLLSICRGYVRVHRPFHSLRVFHKTKDFDCDPTHKEHERIGFPPTVASLNVLIKALCRNEKTVDVGVKIFLEMPKRGCDPDCYTYGTLISGFFRFGRIDEAKLFEEMVEKHCSLTVVTYNSMIHGLCEAKNVGEAMRYLEEMKSKDIEPNVFTYSF